MSYLKSRLAKNEKLLNAASFVYNFLHCSLGLRHRRTNQINTRGAFLRNIKFDISGRDNEIIFEPKVRIRRSKITVIGNNCRIVIGEKSIINAAHFWCEDDHSSIVVGNELTMEGGHIASTEGRSIVVGDDCMFSSGIEIRNGDSHSIVDISTNCRINEAQDVKIGDHVWLCAKATILKGSEIPAHCIIGNSSIVSSKLDNSNTIYSGIPAHPLKPNITWSRPRL